MRLAIDHASQIDEFWDSLPDNRTDYDRYKGIWYWTGEDVRNAVANGQEVNLLGGPEQQEPLQNTPGTMTPEQLRQHYINQGNSPEMADQLVALGEQWAQELEAENNPAPPVNPSPAPLAGIQGAMGQQAGPAQQAPSVAPMPVQSGLTSIQNDPRADTQEAANNLGLTPPVATPQQQQEEAAIPVAQAPASPQQAPVNAPLTPPIAAGLQGIQTAQTPVTPAASQQPTMPVAPVQEPVQPQQPIQPEAVNAPVAPADQVEEAAPIAPVEETPLGYGPESANEGEAANRASEDNADPFGKAYPEYSGKPEEAIEHLLETKEGYVPSAFEKEGLGAIDLPWGHGGKKGFGLAHIIEQRNEQGFNGDEFARSLPAIIRNGKVEMRDKYPGRAYIVNEKNEAVVRLEWDGESRKWLLTAYPTEEFSRSPDRTTDLDQTHDAGKTPPASSERTGEIVSAEDKDGKANQATNQSVLKIPNRPDEAVTYELMEADAVEASHIPEQGFERNPGYRFENERRYHDEPHSQANVLNHAQSLDPDYLLDNTDANHGAPVIDRENNVLGGNSRAMAIRTAYDKFPERAAGYRQKLRENAARLGINPEDVDKYKRPMLVRRLARETSEAEGQALISALNDSFTNSKARRADSKSRGERFSNATLAVLGRGMREAESLREYFDKEESREAVERIIEDGVIQETERNAYTDREGMLNPEGKKLVEEALRSRLASNQEVLARLPQ